MAHAKLSDEVIQQILDMRRRGVGAKDIADQFKINRSTVWQYCKKYLIPEVAAAAATSGSGEPPPDRAEHGQMVDTTEHNGEASCYRMDRPATVEEIMAACKLDPLRWVPQYYKPNSWQGFYKVKDGSGGHQKVRLYQSKAVFKRVVAEGMEDAVLQFVREHVTPVPLDASRGRFGKHPGKKDFAVSWGIWDAHLGMYAWQSEVREDFDLSMATRRVINSIDDMVLELAPYSIEKVWMPVGNDFMHFDSVRHTTAFGEHFLDTDTRYAKVYLAALKCLAHMVDRALEVADEVDVIYVPGNHDITSSFTLCAALGQRYKDDPRVKVDLGANPRKYRSHGGVLIGYDHGQDCRADQYPLIFGTEAKEQWSASTYREVQVGHTHQRRERNYAGVIPTNGLLVRTNPSLCNVDAWHHRQGLIGEPVKSVEAWRYDRVGYRGSHVAWARDDEPVVR